MTGEKDPRDVMQAEHDDRLSEHPAFQAPAEMPGVEEIARVLAEALRQKPIPDDVWRWMVESFHHLEGQFPDYANGYSVSTDAFRLARAVQALFAPILAEKEREVGQLHATIRKAHVAMTMACALPGVASEYDFSEAIASTEATLARRAAALRAEGE